MADTQHRTIYTIKINGLTVTYRQRTLLKPHPLYESLGSDAASRQPAYRELFRYELEPGLVD